jgi:hypothetical protein
MLTLAGCATGVPNVAIDESLRAGIHTVRVNPVVAMPPAIDFFGQSQSIAALAAGPFAALMDDKLSAEPKQRLAQEIQETHIDVPNMLATSFAMRASSDANLTVVSEAAPADAQVDLVVNRYGFAIAHPGTAALFPIFSVSAIMKNAKGQVVWQATDLMSAHFPDNKVGRTLDELQKDPQALRQALLTGSDLVAGMLIRNLKGEEVAQNVPGIQK